MTRISIPIAADADPKKEVSRLSLHLEGVDAPAPIDVDGNALLKVSREIPDMAQDLFTIASCIYAADKAVARTSVDDNWTREIAIEIPIEHLETWSAVAEPFSKTVSYLTGDFWQISFRKGEKRLIQRRIRKRSIPYKRAHGSAVALFSGGLDSYIGALDWLAENTTERLLLVGHYDRDVSGPGADQRRLKEVCDRFFPKRTELAQAQIGLYEGGADTNFRSRSLLFIALGCYFAEVMGDDVPVLISENGPIALNFPLTPARRGSCSTRTVHPEFISGLTHILREVGISNPIINRYDLVTKGEMVAGCGHPAALHAGFALTRSCAKANRRTYWVNKKGALGCGLCIPCLFRRASLHSEGLDTELYGIPVESLDNMIGDAREDILALVTFLRTRHSDREIAARLLANGRLSMEKLSDYVDMIKRMRAEVLQWLKAKGSPFLQNEVRAC